MSTIVTLLILMLRIPNLLIIFLSLTYFPQKWKIVLVEISKSQLDVYEKEPCHLTEIKSVSLAKHEMYYEEVI